MNRASPIRALLLHGENYGKEYINQLVTNAEKRTTLQTAVWEGEDHDYPFDTVDVVLLDLHAVIRQSIDADLLGDTVFSHVPTVLLGDSSIGEYALEAMREGAMDWLIHGHMELRPLNKVLESAIRGFSRQRDLVVSHARYKEVVEDQSEFICRFLPDFSITFANKSYTEYVCKSASSIEGLSLLEITPVQERDGFRQKILALTPQHPVASYDRSVIIEGDVSWQHWSDKAFFDSNGKMIEVQSIGTDITERRSVEQSALDSNARFQALFNHSPVMMCELGSDGVILNINQKCVEVLGYTPHDIVGQNGYRYIDGESRKKLSNSTHKLRSDGWVRDIDCNFYTADRRQIRASVSATAHLDNEKKISGLLVVLVENG